MTTKSEKKVFSKASFARFKYEVFFFVFFIFRFAFENLPEIGRYFTVQPIFNLSDKMSITVGSIVLIATCLSLAFLFGKLLRSGTVEQTKRLSYPLALFLASPVSIPFLFNSRVVNGSQLLYPFALFVFALLISQSAFFRWFLPAVCVLYLVPAAFTAEVFFSFLQKGAVLYIPLLLLFLILNSNIIWQKTFNIKAAFKTSDFVIFVVCFLTSLVSYLCSVKNTKFFQTPFFLSAHSMVPFFFTIALTAPALVAGQWFFREIKNKQAAGSSSIFFLLHIFFFPIFRNNYTGLWIPFLLISIYMYIFFAHQRQEPSADAAITKFSVFVEKHGFIFLILLMTMAVFNDHSSPYLSGLLQRVFNAVPF